MKTIDKLLLVWLLICGGVCMFRYITIPLYNHFLKPKPIEWKWTEVPPKAYTSVPELPKHKGISKTLYGNCVDTLYGGDTIYIYPTKNFGRYGDLEFVVMVDSLSGAIHGTGYIECTDLGLIWNRAPFTEDSYRINGPSPVYMQYDNLIHGKIRAKIIMSSATQSVKIRSQYLFKPSF